MREQRIAIVNEVASSYQGTGLDIGEIASHLLHPLAIRSWRNPGNLNSTALQLDDEEHEVPDQARAREHFNAKEVGCCDGTLEDTRLSWAARGLLGYLLAKPDDWMLRIGDLRKRGDLGRDALYKHLKLLQQVGYVQRRLTRDPKGHVFVANS